MKKLQILLLIICTLFVLNKSYAVKGGIEYDSINVDYSILNKNIYQKIAMQNLKKAQSIKDINQKRIYYGYAAGAFEALAKMSPQNPEAYTMLGYIQGKLGNYSLAKSYFFQATNLDKNNPHTNYYFGKFYDNNEEYLRALSYYKISYINGYFSNYDLNYALGTLYEKLADLKKAKYHYQRANSIKPSQALRNKIRLIDDTKYNKSLYYKYGNKLKIN